MTNDQDFTATVRYEKSTDWDKLNMLLVRLSEYHKVGIYKMQGFTEILSVNVM